MKAQPRPDAPREALTFQILLIYITNSSFTRLPSLCPLLCDPRGKESYPSHRTQFSLDKTWTLATGGILHSGLSPPGEKQRTEWEGEVLAASQAGFLLPTSILDVLPPLTPGRGEEMRCSGQSHWKEGKSSAHSLHARPLFLYACGLSYRHTLGLKKDAGSPAVCMDGLFLRCHPRFIQIFL